ncbi:protein ripply2.2-like [Gastrophryne carolinensis]
MQGNKVTPRLTMEQTLANDTNMADHGLASVSSDCYSCKCIRRRDRTFFTGYSRASRRAQDTGPQRPHIEFWRPWIHYNARQKSRKSSPYARGLCENPQAALKPAQYNHPVRLFWPKSKPLDNMYMEAVDLLRSFPVQATLSFYNDSESDTDSDDSNSEEENDSGFESE